LSESLVAIRDIQNITEFFEMDASVMICAYGLLFVDSVSAYKNSGVPKYIFESEDVV
jgi:hypothetical protein